MAYGQLYACPNVMLLYPHHRDLPLDPSLCQRQGTIRRSEIDEMKKKYGSK
jgi:hypothetical protein